MSIFPEFNSDNSSIKSFSNIEDDYEKVLYSCELEKEEKEEGSLLYLIVYKTKQIAILIGNQNKENWDNSMLFFKRFYPFITRIFLRSFQILEILKFVEKESNLKLIAKTYVAKRYFGNKKTEICHEKISYEKAFNQALNDGLWIDSILVGLEQKESILGSVRLNRKGIFTFTGIYFSDFYNNFLTKVIKFFLESYLSIIENKSRSFTNVEPKPVKIVVWIER